MKKFNLVIGLLALGLMAFYFYPKSARESLKVGLVMPVQNVALDDIVDGFKSELTSLHKGRPIEFGVQNALGDINLQKSALNKFINEKVDLLVPIGKGASLMALNLAPKEQPVLFLASFILPDSDAAKAKPGLMGVIDEIPVELQLKFIRAAKPDLKKLALIYVSSDKIFDDVKEFTEKADSFGITVQKLMVQNVADLYTVASRIEGDNQAIFTLKDVLVASGINALVQQANTLKIPLITSDEGTVKSGAAFAVGVTESDIGRQGAKIASAFLEHANIDHPIQFLDKVSVFVNRASCEAQGVDLEALKKAAASLNLNVIEG